MFVKPLFFSHQATVCCLMKSLRITKPLVRAMWRAYVEIKQEHIRPLQKECVTPHSCLVTHDEALKSTFRYSGVDQALIPLEEHKLKRIKNHIPPFEIDIEKVASKEDLDACFLDPRLRIVMTSALGMEQIEEMNKPKPSTIEGYIQSHSCSNLSWLPDSDSLTSKSFLGHRCPAVSGMSGSFMKLECGGKLGLFVDQGHRGEGESSKEAWEKVQKR